MDNAPGVGILHAIVVSHLDLEPPLSLAPVAQDNRQPYRYVLGLAATNGRQRRC